MGLFGNQLFLCFIISSGLHKVLSCDSLVKSVIENPKNYMYTEFGEHAVRLSLF